MWNFCVDSLLVGDSENWSKHWLDEKPSNSVVVPHAWNADKGLERYWGVCWYQRTFEISPNQLSKIARLQFDAVYHDVIIYVNGNKAGEHYGSGYTRFFIDITPYIKVGTNIVTVSADNSPSRSNIPFQKSYDWANDGGIFRNVYLVLTQPQAIQNIHVTAEPKEKTGVAKIKVSFIDISKIHNSKFKLNALIVEENQTTSKQVFKGELNGKFENGYFIAALKFDNINPWHFDSPNLYKLAAKLIVDGIEKDEYSTVFGFRRITIENNRYVLNGEPIRLMGVEWMAGSNLERGMAETKTDMEKNLKLMKNVNCIFTRFHWQQDEFVLDWCDRNGILIQEEIPYWGWETYINDTLLAKGIQHLNEMIDDHYNHPSIIAWGIGNEVGSKNIANIAALKILYNHAKSLDSSRLVNYVSNHLFWGFPSEGIELPDATSYFDMMMFNEYFSTWHGKSIDVVSEELDKIAKEYPHKPLTISEWGICEPVHKGGDPRRCEEMIQQSTIYGSKDYIAGAIYFCLNDYRTHMGEDSTYSYPQRVHGVCDIHLNPKPSFDTLKHISSPIIIKSVALENDEAIITLQGKTGIPSYTVRNYTIVSGKNKARISELKPGEEKTFKIKTGEKEFTILRPTGYEVIRSKFR
jgi:beta-glucuronidase